MSSVPEVPDLGVPDEAGRGGLSTSIIAEEDQRRLVRLLTRTLGGGFKLAMIEVASPRDRMAVLDWLAPVLTEMRAQQRALDLAEHAQALELSGDNLWSVLRTELPAGGLDERTVLSLWGFEEVMYRRRASRPELLQQINVQRDILARDYPCFWLVFIHPGSRQLWHSVAPDFTDFAAIWVAAHGSGGTTPTGRSGISRVSPDVDAAPLHLRDSKAWPSILVEANKHLSRSRYDQALDRIHSYRAGAGPSPAEERGSAIADLLEARILRVRGELEGAMRLLRERAIPAFERVRDVRLRAVALDQLADLLQLRGEVGEALQLRSVEVLPVFERLGDVRSRALTQGKIADVLMTRGELNEALRRLRDEVLPVFERLGDARSRAVTQGRIAKLLMARGELDEALPMLRDEVLPVFERLGDVRERAVTQGKIADVLMARGELDEALRILLDEVLPVFGRLGDVRSRAVTQGRIADVLMARGERDEALRIFRDEVLPAFESLGDVRSRAVTQGRIADVLMARGELDEALRIRREEQLPVYERLGDVRSHAGTQGQIANLLEQRGEQDEALRIFREDVLPVFERIGNPADIAWARRRISELRQRRR